MVKSDIKLVYETLLFVGQGTDTKLVYETPLFVGQGTSSAQ